MLETPSHARILWRQISPHLRILLFIAVLTFAFRIINLTLWPIFADEAIYLRWSQVMRAEPSLRFLPLTDGKQPLYMWLTIPFLKIFDSPLFAGRFLSTLCGTASALGLYIFTYQLTRRRLTATLVSFLYATIPYTVFFDRYALADSMLLMLGIWSLIFVYITASSTRLDTALVSGGLLGASLLTKSPGLVFIALGFLAPLTQSRQKIWHYFKYFCLFALIGVISFAIYNLLRLGPEFHQINLRNADYRFPTSEIIAQPFKAAQINAPAVLSFYFYLITPVILLFSFFGAFKLWRTSKSLLLFLLLWIFAPSLLQVFIARSVTARYFLFTTPAILILSSIGITQIFYTYRRQLPTKLLISALIFSYPIYQTVLILTRPQSVMLPRIERSGYLEEWTSGQGMEEIVEYIEDQSQLDTVVVGTEGFFGTTPDGLQIYFDKHPRVTILGNSHLLDRVPQSLYDATKDNLVYLLINDERLMIQDPQSSGLRLIKSYPKATRPNGTHQSFMLYQVVSTN